MHLSDCEVPFLSLLAVLIVFIGMWSGIPKSAGHSRIEDHYVLLMAPSIRLPHMT